jgi:3',5'-cyclic AMP phosphodiesterase CpdA
LRRIVHISDLHFGAHDSAAIAPLTQCIHQLDPHLVVCSGDLTANAEAAQFQQARKFLSSLPQPQLTIPGNHDLSFFNPLRRILQRRRNFRRSITRERYPTYKDSQISAIGVDTTRVFHLRNGKIRPLQALRVANHFHRTPPETVRILVTHHPFDLPEHFHQRELVRHARRTLERLSPHVDLFLAGHMHIGYAESTSLRWQAIGSEALYVQAGTATSRMERGEEKSFNVIETEFPEIRVQPWQWSADAQDFLPAEQRSFRLARNPR